MNCLFCRSNDTKVIDSRISEDGISIRRRRECQLCRRRFTTLETASLTVMKRNGTSEPFRREKIVTGVHKACQGRPVTKADLAILAQRVEENLRAGGNSQIKATEIGLAILPELLKLDQVAYIRFASVYQDFDSLEDFSRAVQALKSAKE